MKNETRKSLEEETEERIEKIDREIIHFTFTILLSALTAITIVSLAIK